MSMPSIITLDDRDPRLKWAGGYFLGPRGPDPQEYGQSDTILEEPGSTMTFTFNGSYVAVYGSVDPPDETGGLARTSYSLDGQSPYEYTASNTNVSLYDVLFYQTTADDNANPHTLVVTSLSGTPVFDYIKYIPSVEETTSGTTTTTNMPSSSSTLYTSNPSTNKPISTAAATNSSVAAVSSSSSLFSTVTGSRAVTILTGPSSISSSSSSSSSPFATSSTESSVATTTPITIFEGSHQTNVRAIAGGAVGCAALVFAALILLFSLRRRGKQLRDLQEMNTSLEPYADDGPSHTLPMASHVKSLPDVTRANPAPSPSTLASASTLIANPVELSRTQQEQGEAQPLVFVPVPTRLHEDGGFRIEWDADVSENDVPPVYRRYSSEPL